MQPERRRRSDHANEHVLDLPPPFRAVTLREAGDAFSHACEHAATLGAGSLVFVGRFDVAEFAVILEPTEALASARRVFYAGMVALYDALAATAPPQRSIHIQWPDAIYVAGGLAGGGRIGWPDNVNDRAIADWVVFGAELRLAAGDDAYSTAATFDDENVPTLGADTLVASFARYFLAAVDSWQADGFAGIAKRYIARLEPESQAGRGVKIERDQRAPSFDARVYDQTFLASLKLPSWRDPVTGELRR